MATLDALGERYRALPPEERLRIARQASPETRAYLARLERGMAIYRSPGAMAAALTGGREWQARHLDLIDRAFVRIADGERMRVLINMPPRHGKSNRAVRWAPLWYLARHPDHRIMIASYAAKLAEGHGRWLRNAIDEYGPQLGISLQYGSRAANRFDIHGSPGGLVTAGVGGGLTGMGANVAVVDDPLKDAQEADSPTKLARLWDWWQQVLNTRMEPDGSIVVIQTRWSEHDLAGRILQQGAKGWTVINLPAIADSADDALGRAIGEPLWPERFTARHLEEFRKDAGERGWWSLYQQQPRPMEGGVWHWDWITRHRIPLEAWPGVDPARIVVAVDPAGGGGSDETGLVAAASDKQGDLYVLADRSRRMSAAEWGTAACLLALELKADAIVVEANFGGDMPQQVVQQAWRELERDGTTRGLQMPRLIDVHAKLGKRLRAEPIAQLYENGRVHHVGEFPGLEVQMVSWMPTMDSPDRMDAAVHALTELATPGKGAVGQSSYSRAQPRGRR